MAATGTYQGYALQLVDEKGRVAIPASLRSALNAHNTVALGLTDVDPKDIDPKVLSLVMIGFHESDRCLVGYDLGHSARLHARLANRAEQNAGPEGAPLDKIVRAGMAAESLPFDASGRFIMPGFPRNRARIGKYAFFYGVGDKFEIWDPAEVIASDTTPDLMKDAVRYFMAERGESL